MQARSCHHDHHCVGMMHAREHTHMHVKKHKSCSLISMDLGREKGLRFALHTGRERERRAAKGAHRSDAEPSRPHL